MRMNNWSLYAGLLRVLKRLKAAMHACFCSPWCDAYWGLFIGVWLFVDGAGFMVNVRHPTNQLIYLCCAVALLATLVAWMWQAARRLQRLRKRLHLAEREWTYDAQEMQAMQRIIDRLMAEAKAKDTQAERRWI